VHKPAHDRALARLAPQPSHHALGRGRGHVDPAAHEHGVVARHLLEVAVEPKTDARAAIGDIAPIAHQRPGIKLAARHAIGDAQGFDRAGKTQHGELVQKDEDEPPGACVVGHLGAFACRAHAGLPRAFLERKQFFRADAIPGRGDSGDWMGAVIPL
jgi:hypothetical protein